MLTKQHLADALKTTEERLTAKIEASRKEFNEGIETAVAQISSAVVKSLENVANKDDVKRLESRVGKVENRLGNVENRLGKVEDRLGNVETELIYVKTGLRDLKADTPTDKEFHNHERRITKLEQTVFPS